MDDGFDMSLQQQRLWLAEGGPSVTVSAVLQLDASPEMVRAALDRCALRFEILRTTFSRPAGMNLPVQVVHDSLAPAWTECDTASMMGEVTKAADSLDAERGPVLAAVYAPSDSGAWLALTALATNADARTLELLGAQLRAELAGVVPSADDEPLQYADFAAWQSELLAADDTLGHAAAAHWASLTATPTALPGGAAGSGRGVLPVEIPAEVAAQLASGDAAGNWLAVYAVAIARLLGSEDIRIGVVVDGRSRSELADALGPFAVPVPVQLSVGRDASFADVAAAAGAAQATARGFAERPPATARERIAFAWHDGIGDIEAAADGAPGDLHLAVASASQGVYALLSYARSVLTDAAAARIARHIAAVAGGAAASADTATKALPIWAEADRSHILTTLAAGAAPLEAMTVFPRQVEAAAVAHPQRTAVVGGDASLSYAELDDKASRLARLLQAKGAGADRPVAILLGRTSELIVAILAAHKAGAAYVPLHADHPAARLAFQLADTHAAVTVTTTALADLLPADASLIALDTATQDLAGVAAGPLDTAPSLDDAAYIIYTSGSTGTPKGVVVTHANVASYIAAITEKLAPSLGDVDPDGVSFALVTTTSTDLGNTSLFPSLASGGRLLVVPADIAIDSALYRQWVATNPVDVLKITPSHLGALLAGGPGVLPRKVLVTGGEASTWGLIDRVRESSAAKILNHYGPTEATIGSLVYDVPEAGNRPATGTVPVGRPLRGETVFLLDDAGQPVPIGAPGELCIGGVGVARGYLGRDDLTAERFVADPNGGRMYRTGDLARFLPDGNVEFLGRADEQVKIRGYRVEPGEIAEALRQHAKVAQAAVVAAPDKNGDLRLVGYVVGSVTTAADVEDLRAHLSARLPEHMVPSLIVPIDAIPLMANGKLDKAALPAPETSALGTVTDYVAPSTPTEQIVADIWVDVLGVPRVGVHEDFFMLGGHSLLATQVIARILGACDVQLPLHSIFTTPTVAGLAAAVDAMRPDDTDLAALLAELEAMSDEEAQNLLNTDGDG